MSAAINTYFKKSFESISTRFCKRCSHYFPDAYFFCSSFSGIRCQPEQTQTGNDDSQYSQCSNNSAYLRIGAIELIKMVIEKLVIKRCVSTIFFPYRFDKCNRSFCLSPFILTDISPITPILLVKHEHRFNLIMQRIKIEISCYAHYVSQRIKAKLFTQ